MSNDRNQFMQEAIHLSAEKMRQGQGGPFGAVVVKDGRIVGRGWNKVLANGDPTAHAEVEAIRDACRNLGTYQLTGAEIYTSCEPCPMCLAAIYWARLGGIFYANSRTDAAAIGFDDDFLYREIPKPLSERAIPMRRCLEVEAAAVFEEWKKKPDKIPY